LMNWGELQQESNLCFGEGGAGTWSDGKLTTRLNAPEVRHVLTTLVEMGGPERILLDGKPHVGTDRLVILLKRFRAALVEAGAEGRSCCGVERLARGESGGVVRGVELAAGGLIEADRVILAVGHSSHGMYRRLVEQRVAVEPKAFAVGFRVEHPQALINRLQY